MTRFVLVSDVHCREVQTPPGDILITAGDMTMKGTLEEFQWLEEWFRKQPQKRKFFVPGNHDWGAFSDQRVMRADVLKTPKWLVDEEVYTLDNIRIYGSPWTQTIYGAKHWAFPLLGGSHSQEKWAEIPESLDILITHGPPYGISDEHWATGSKLGDNYLLWRLLDLAGKAPKFHVFGHIHSGQKFTQLNDTVFLNVAICDEDYKDENPITILDYQAGSWTVSHVDREGQEMVAASGEIAFKERSSQI